MFAIHAEIGAVLSRERAGTGGALETKLDLRLIGPPAVRLRDQKLTHQQQALLAFVGLRGPVSGEDIALALWQGRLMSASRLPNLLAEVRGAVGRHRLPPSEDGYYRLHDVHSDTGDLDALCASDEDSDERGEHWLYAALSLLAKIEGPPLHRSAAPGRAYWAWLDDCFVLRAHVERQISYLASNVARILADDSGRRAIWALEKGLSAVPGDEQLRNQLALQYRAMGFNASARTVGEPWRGSN